MDNDHEITISDIPDGTVFYIPDYQRGYRWTEKEVSALLDDLLAFALSGETGETYCLQPLVLQRKNGRLWVVDGQQRLTTMSIILCSLGLASGWDIEYTAEGGRRLGELLKFPGASINDYFRNMARKTVSDWLKVDASRREDIGRVLSGESDKRVVFLRHDLREDENGHEAFQRLNAGKTPLTSSELIRALYMEAGNGLDNGEKADIAKEWSLIESALAEESFWSIWANKRFRDVPTRMDFLLSIVADIDSEKARQDPLLVYRAFEKAAMNAECRLVSAEGLRRLWEETLRCWWWMQSCNADVEAFHLLGWLSLFTGRKTRVLFRELWKDTAGCRMEAFKGDFEKSWRKASGKRILTRSDMANANLKRYARSLYSSTCWSRNGGVPASASTYIGKGRGMSSISPRGPTIPCRARRTRMNGYDLPWRKCPQRKGRNWPNARPLPKSGA